MNEKSRRERGMRRQIKGRGSKHDEQENPWKGPDKSWSRGRSGLSSVNERCQDCGICVLQRFHKIYFPHSAYSIFRIVGKKHRQLNTFSTKRLCGNCVDDSRTNQRQGFSISDYSTTLTEDGFLNFQDERDERTCTILMIRSIRFKMWIPVLYYIFLE